MVSWVPLFILSLFVFGLGPAQAASPSVSFTLDGRLYSDTAGTTALVDSNVQMQIQIQILNPAQDCILYEELQSLDTSSSNGYFSAQVGSLLGAAKRHATRDPGLTMSQIYSNRAAVNGKDPKAGFCK